MDKLVDLIRELALKLGIEGARLWPEIVAVTWTKAFIWLTAEVVILLPLTAIVAYKLLSLSSEKSKKYKMSGDTRDDDSVECANIFVILLVGLCVVMLISVPGLVTTVLHPEGATVLWLLGK